MYWLARSRQLKRPRAARILSPRVERVEDHQQPGEAPPDGDGPAAPRVTMNPSPYPCSAPGDRDLTTDDLLTGVRQLIETVKPAIEVFSLRRIGFDDLGVIAGTAQKTAGQQPFGIGTDNCFGGFGPDNAISGDAHGILQELDRFFSTMLHGGIKDKE